MNIYYTVIQMKMHLWWPSKQSNYSTKLIFGVLGKMTHMYMYDPLCALSKNIHLIIHNRKIVKNVCVWGGGAYAYIVGQSQLPCRGTYFSFPCLSQNLSSSPGRNENCQSGAGEADRSTSCRSPLLSAVCPDCPDSC